MSIGCRLATGFLFLSRVAKFLFFVVALQPANTYGEEPDEIPPKPLTPQNVTSLLSTSPLNNAGVLFAIPGLTQPSPAGSPVTPSPNQTPPTGNSPTPNQAPNDPSAAPPADDAQNTAPPAPPTEGKTPPSAEAQTQPPSPAAGGAEASPPPAFTPDPEFGALGTPKAPPDRESIEKPSPIDKSIAEFRNVEEVKEMQRAQLGAGTEEHDKNLAPSPSFSDSISGPTNSTVSPATEAASMTQPGVIGGGNFSARETPPNETSSPPTAGNYLPSSFLSSQTAGGGGSLFKTSSSSLGSTTGTPPAGMTPSLPNETKGGSLTELPMPAKAASAASMVPWIGKSLELTEGAFKFTPKLKPKSLLKRARGFMRGLLTTLSGGRTNARTLAAGEKFRRPSLLATFIPGKWQSADFSEEAEVTVPEVLFMGFTLGCLLLLAALLVGVLLYYLFVLVPLRRRTRRA